MTHDEYKQLCYWSLRLGRAWYICRKPTGEIVIRLGIPKGSIELFRLIGKLIIDTRKGPYDNAYSTNICKSSAASTRKEST